LLPRASSKVNTGESAKRTTAETDDTEADALAAGLSATLAGGAAETALALGEALGSGAFGGVVSEPRAGGETAGSGSGSGSGSGAGAEAAAAGGAELEAGTDGEAEADADAEPDATGRGVTEAEGAGRAGATAETAADALAGVACACSRAGLTIPRTATQTGRNQCPQARADVQELTEYLTLGRRASVTTFTTASTIQRGKSAPRSP
jgi:hypothetical protein